MKRDIHCYLILGIGKIPIYYRLRDLVITLSAWLLWGWLCWDIIHLFHLELLNRLTGNLPREMINWAETVEELRASFESSGTIIVVLFFCGIVNLSRSGRIGALQRHDFKPLTVEQQAPYYGCRGEDVIEWRKCRILTIEISDTGVIENVRTD